MDSILQNGLLLVVILDIPVGIFTLHSISHFVSLLSILSLLFNLLNFFRHFLCGVCNIPFSVDVGGRELLNGIFAVLSHLFLQFLLVVLLFVDVVVGADDWVVIVGLPITLLGFLFLLLFLLVCFLFIVDFIVSRNDVVLPRVLL